ncbi:unnamed protein product [Acanthoscelides obtectus]|uniref:Uncharacterized protein n=1 Tax=Acanthoscelides obtectus TaxID=200917 RepID=A0A9P0Q259_ACAOB|nr:unnamed protein product [Acanthoscelides obtectus]CAK1629238.1 hypothetical protein AOBTE_LOCUS5634 [Acanthoscelides obtectus]
MNIDEYDYDLYIDKYYNPDAINYDEETFFDVLVNCALLSIQSILPILSRLICTNLCFGVLTSVCK